MRQRAHCHEKLWRSHRTSVYSEGVGEQAARYRRQGLGARGCGLELGTALQLARPRQQLVCANACDAVEQRAGSGRLATLQQARSSRSWQAPGIETTALLTAFLRPCWPRSLCNSPAGCR